MPSLEFIINSLQKFFDAKPVESVWLFGSYARGENTDNSDIDLLVRFQKDKVPSLLKYAGMIVELEEILNRSVDLVKEDSLFPEIKPFVDKDKILVYERTH